MGRPLTCWVAFSASFRFGTNSNRTTFCCRPGPFFGAMATPHQTYAHRHAHTYTQTCTQTHTHTHSLPLSLTHSHTHTHTRTRTHTHTHTHTHAHSHTHTHWIVLTRANKKKPQTKGKTNQMGPPVVTGRLSRSAGCAFGLGSPV